MQGCRADTVSTIAGPIKPDKSGNKTKDTSTCVFGHKCTMELNSDASFPATSLYCAQREPCLFIILRMHAHDDVGERTIILIIIVIVLIVPSLVSLPAS